MSSRRLKIRIGMTMILLFTVFVFAVQNAALVDIRLFGWQIELPRSLLIFVMLVIGFIIGWSTRVIYRVLKG